MFNIPMNTKPAMSISDLASSLNGGSTPAQAPAQQAPMQQPQTNYQQPAPQMNQPAYQQPAPQPQYNQPVPQPVQQTQYNQPPYQQPAPQPQYNQPAPQPVQQTYQQPAPALAPQPVQRPVQNSSTAPVSHYDKKASGGVSLKKGGKTSLTNLLPPGSTRIKVCLGWDVGANTTYDLDSSCFMLGEDGKVVGDEWFVFYNQPESPDGAIKHNGDNKTGNGDGDDEIIDVNLGMLNPGVKKLAFVITINDEDHRGYSFKSIANAYARILDANSGKELAIFNLSDYGDGITAMAVCEIYNHKGEWKINPVGNGLANTDLLGLCNFYGVNVTD